MESKRNMPSDLTTKTISFDEIEVVWIKNPRKFYDGIKELSLSIKNRGLINPPLVKQIDENKYQLVAGYRRMKAIRLIREKVIGNPKPFDTIDVRVTNKSGVDLKILNLSENTHESLKIYELGKYVQHIIKVDDLSVSEIAKMSGWSITKIYNAWSVVTKCSPLILKALSNGLENQKINGKYISGNTLVKWSQLPKEEQEREFKRWLGETPDIIRAEAKRVRYQPSKKVNRYLQSLLNNQLQLSPQENRDIQTIIRTLEWIMRIKKHPPVRLELKRK